jgi:3-oxoacyl-[acyl-carrier-protein] synthase-3
MNTHCHIIGLGSFVPERVLSNRDLEGMVDTSDEWITSRTGIKRRHILDDDSNASDMAAAASRLALADAGLEPGDVTHVFVSTCTPDHLCPSVACLVAGKLGIGPRGASPDGRVMCVDLNAACSGFIYGLELARAVLALHPDAAVLLVGAEALSRRMNYADRATCVLFGDGAGAVVLRSSPAKSLWPVRDVTCCADGSRHDLIVMGGGSAMRVRPGDAVPGDFFTAMRGNEVFRCAVRAMSAESGRILERNGLGMEDVDLVVAHQANQRIVEAVGSRLGVPKHKIFLNVREFGNTSSATLPLALDDARSQGKIRPGMTALLVTFGGGVTWGAALLG